MRGIPSIACAGIIVWAWLLQAEAAEFHPVVSFGYDQGGDSIVDLVLIDPRGIQPDLNEKVSAGRGFTLAAGVYIPVMDGLGLQATAGAKLEGVSGMDTFVGFDRITYDGLMYMHLTEHHSIALGATYHTAVKLSCSTENPNNSWCNFSDQFDNAWGTSAEYLYAVHDSAEGGLKLGLRYTQIEYSHPIYGPFDGSSVGLILYAY